MIQIPLLVIVMILMIWNTTQSGGGDIKLLYSLVKNTGMKVVEFVRERVREEKAQRAGYF